LQLETAAQAWAEPIGLKRASDNSDFEKQRTAKLVQLSDIVNLVECPVKQRSDPPTAIWPDEKNIYSVVMKRRRQVGDSLSTL